MVGRAKCRLPVSSLAVPGHGGTLSSLRIAAQSFPMRPLCARSALHCHNLQSATLQSGECIEISAFSAAAGGGDGGGVAVHPLQPE